ASARVARRACPARRSSDLFLLRPARADGLGATAGRPSPAVALATPLLGAVIALATLGLWAGAIALLSAGGAVTLAATLARRQIEIGRAHVLTPVTIRSRMP